MTRTMRGRVAVAVAALAAASLLASCSTPGEPEGPRHLTIGITAGEMVGTYAIANFSDQGMDSFAVYDRLFTPEYYPQPSLATGFEIAEDRMSVTIDLREGVEFSDGQEFNAETYVEFCQRLLDMGEDWGFYPQLSPFGPSVEAVDDYTVKWTVTEAPINADSTNYPSFLNIVFRMHITSVAALDDPLTESGDPIESGAYLVGEIVPSVSVELIKNETFWNADNYPFDTVTLTVFEDDVAKLNALKGGQIDAAGLGSAYVQEAIDSGFSAAKLTPGPLTMLFIGDSSGTLVPALGDQRVRQAISLAFDRETINETLNFGLGDVTSQPWDPNRPEWVEGGDDRYGYDPERARELLAEAGYADGFDLTIPTGIGLDKWEPIVQQSLADIGIRVTYEQFGDVGAAYDAMLAAKYPVMLVEFGPQVVRAILIVDDALLNPFHPDHPKIDELWDFINTGDGGPESDEAAQELGEYVLDQALIAVFASSPSYIVTVPGVTLPDEASWVNLGSYGVEE